MTKTPGGTNRIKLKSKNGEKTRNRKQANVASMQLRRLEQRFLLLLDEGRRVQRNLAFKQKHLEMVYILFEESSEQKNGQVKEFRT